MSHLTVLRRVSVVVLLALASSAPSANAATSDVSYGWWSQAGGVAPAPPDVPADGMYAQQGPTGPVAFAAIAFTLPSGQAPSSFKVRVVGTPVITAAPFACPVTSAIKPAQNGAWSDQPTFDCTSKVSGVVDANQQGVTFSIDRAFVTGGVLQVAVFAGTVGDRLPLDRPAAVDLATESVAPRTGDTSLQTGSVATPTPVFAEPVPVQSALPAATGGTALAPHAPAAARPPVAVDVPSAPTVLAGERSATPPAGWRGALGLALAIAVIVYWAQGFGALPWRSRAVQRLSVKAPASGVRKKG